MCDLIFTTALLNPRRTQSSPNLRGLSCKAKKIFSSDILVQIANIKFQENPFRGRRVVP
jgi:hypothetical protein